jgi:hypothetical protein
MMWLKGKIKTTTREPGLLNKLIADLLYLVLEQLVLADSSLLDLCQKSRYLYLQTVPHLYRRITFDFTRASHLRLLDRLAKPNSCLPGMIREIGIASIEGKHVEQKIILQRLSVVFSALKHVERFWWSAESLDMPLFILDALHGRF